MILNENDPDDVLRGSIIHEAQHHGGLGMSPQDEAIAEAAVACMSLAREDEDDPDPGDPGNGGEGGGGGGEGGGETCKEVEHPAMTDTRRVWVPASPGGEHEAKECDFGAELCTGISITGGGRWEEQEFVIKKAWTERVCTSN